jgi:hypothetical protein
MRHRLTTPICAIGISRRGVPNGLPVMHSSRGAQCPFGQAMVTRRRPARAGRKVASRQRSSLPHAVRNATVGDIRDARTAGIRPANAPIRMAEAMPPSHASTGIATAQQSSRASPKHTTERSPSPPGPPAGSASRCNYPPQHRTLARLSRSRIGAAFHQTGRPWRERTP